MGMTLYSTALPGPENGATGGRVVPERREGVMKDLESAAKLPGKVTKRRESVTRQRHFVMGSGENGTTREDPLTELGDIATMSP
jgi:hypothetical protein